MKAKKQLDPAYGSDDWLRSFGFVIHSRPTDGPVLWKSPTGGILTQLQAMARCKDGVYLQFTSKA